MARIEAHNKRSDKTYTQALNEDSDLTLEDRKWKKSKSDFLTFKTKRSPPKIPNFDDKNIKIPPYCNQ